MIDLTSETIRAMPAKKKVTRKKVRAGKKKVARKKRAARVEVPMSAKAEALSQKVTRAEGSLALAQSKVQDLRDKVRDARAKLKATGDGRAKRTIDSSADKMAALAAKVATSKASVSAARAALKEQTSADAQSAKRDAALAAAVEKFSARWLKTYDRKMRQRARAKRAKKKV